MTPLLSTRPLHPVMVHFGEDPSLPDVFDVVRVGLALGLNAIAHLVDTRQAVGPYLGCREHATLLIPVKSGTADSWGAPYSDYSDCSRHTTVSTIRCGQSYGRSCRSCVWVEQFSLGARMTTTDPVALKGALSLQRSRLARGAGQLAVSPVRDVCHA
ncbi:hypothetical protein ACFVRD_33435 [Streptomyces sp. NPDC057908]|uniref:hypothetical protein n=1 Tax=Streptomyces sp. NPDC057908 TaxID=3346276 RepID=UPI0036E4C50B